MKRRIVAILILIGMVQSITCISGKMGIVKIAEAAVSYAMEYDSLPASTKSNCVAFARYKVPTLPSGLWTLQDKKNIINSYTPKVGAIAITTGNSSYGHVAYVEAINGSQITTLNGGWENGAHIGRYTATAAAQGIIGYWYPAPSYYNPEGILDSITSSAGQLTLSGWAFDRDSTSTTLRIDVYIDGTVPGHGLGNGSANVSRPDVDNAYGVGKNHGFKFTLNTGSYSGNHTIDVWAINVGGGDNVRIASKSVYIQPKPSDTEKPVITDISVYNISATGYDVKCKATDNVGVVRVQFPTWTDANWQDDIQPDWWINSKATGTREKNGYYTYHVNIAEHKNELGLYHTHIYAFDKAGNSAWGYIPDVTLKKVKPAAYKKNKVTNISVPLPTPVTTRMKVGKVYITSLKSGKRAFKVKYKKAKNALGYQIVYSTSSKFTSSKSIHTKGKSVKRRKLKKKKIYYVKVRAYNKNVYGSWSAVKKVKTK